jgi:hypothetical protein
MKETINTTFTVLVPGFCFSSSFNYISRLHTASVVLCLGLPPISATIAGYSLAALY